MKNITEDDFRFGTLVWGTVVSLLLGSIIWGVTIQNNNNHRFDVTCVSSGKSLVYEALEGEDYAKKMCK
jgi:hypothetical protein